MCDGPSRCATGRRTDAAHLPGARTPAAVKSTYEPIVGDDIASHPVMPGAPKYDPPTTIEVVRPERTIVRDVDETLPIALLATALLLVLATFGFTLARTRLLPRPGRSN